MATIHIGFRADKDTPSGPYSQCIYCRDSTNPKALTDEHAIPEALGGRVVLKQASCLSCLDRINPYEGKCLNKMFSLVRAYLGIRGTKAKGLKGKYPIDLVIGDKVQTLRIPIHEHPMMLAMVEIDPPGLLTMAAPTKEFVLKRWHYCQLNDFAARKEKLQVKHGASEVLFNSHFDADAFGRFIAKIGHCTAIHLFGLDSFKPYLIDIILRKDDHIPHFVGAADPLPTGDPNKPNHAFAWTLLHGPNNHTVLACFIRLFAWLEGSLTYCVVVGEPTEELMQRLRVRDA